MSSPQLFDPKTTMPPKCKTCEATNPSDCLFKDVQWYASKPKTCLTRYDPSKASIPF